MAHDNSPMRGCRDKSGATLAARRHLDSTTAMTSHAPSTSTAPDPHLVPPILAVWLAVFRPCFTTPVWNRVLVLVAGAVLAPGKRTVTQVLRVMGLADEPGFQRYHDVLSRARWDARAVARRLLLYIIERLQPSGELVIGVDDSSERRWGARIKARGIYRDPVRSSKGHFVKTSGLRWLSLMVCIPIPWAELAKVPAAMPLESQRRGVEPGLCRFSPSSHPRPAGVRRTASATRHSPPGRSRRSCRQDAGCPIAASSSSPIAALRHSICCTPFAARSA